MFNHSQGADGDEIDGMDETILPVDYEKTGQIVDDDMHEILVQNLKPGNFHLRMQ